MYSINFFTNAMVWFSGLTGISITGGKSLTADRITFAWIDATVCTCVIYVVFLAAIVWRWVRFSEAPDIWEFHFRFIIVLIVTRVKRKANNFNIVNSQQVCVQANHNTVSGIIWKCHWTQMILIKSKLQMNLMEKNKYNNKNCGLVMLKMTSHSLFPFSILCHYFKKWLHILQQYFIDQSISKHSKTTTMFSKKKQASV